MKKITALLAVAAVFINLMPVTSAARLNIEQDFEDFAADKTFTVKEGGYKIGEDTSKYLMVPNTASEAEMPVINVNYAGDFTLEFDAKRTEQQLVRILAKFENGDYYNLFHLLVDGRGPILRETDDSPFFMYNSGEATPDVNQWHSYKFDFNYETKTIAASVDGVQIEKFYGRGYVDATPTFPGTKLESLKLVADQDKTGCACFDNIRIYAGGGSETEFTDDSYKSAYKKIEALGGVPDLIYGYPMEQNLTRGEFTTLIMQTLGLNLETKTGSDFEDVTSDMECASAVDMAVKLGFVSKGAAFRPNDPIKLSEAVTILCNITGYDAMAGLYGGWPDGYMSIASDYNLTDNIRIADYRQLVNVKDAYILAENLLTAPHLVKKVSSAEDVRIEEDEDVNVLLKYHGLKEIKCSVDSYDEKNRLITFTEDGAKTYTAIYEADMTDLEDTVLYAWVTEDYENVKYVYPVSDSAVVYGYIEEVNGSDFEKAYTVSEIKRITATNCVSTHVASGVEITLNGMVPTAAFTPIGMYSRIVVTKGEITKIDIYSLTKGGMIESAGGERIIYITGTSGYSIMEDISDTKAVRVILDNAPATIKDLKADTYFDYAWIDGGLIVIASRRSAQGVLTQVASDMLVIKTENGEVEFSLSLSDFYIAPGEEEYSTEHKPSDFMGLEVTVWADSNGRARYMRAAEKNEFYGVVIRYDDELSESEYPTLTLAKIENGAVKEEVFDVDIKNHTIYYPEVSFAEAASNCRKTDGSGVYKFSLKNNRITKIEAVSWHGSAPVTLDAEFDYRAVRLRFNGTWRGINQNRILLLKNGRGEFEVQTVKWSDLVNKLAGGTKALVETTEPIAKITILTEYEKSVYTDGNSFGFIENVSEYYGEDDEIHVKYSLAWRTSLRTVDTFSDDVLKSGTTPLEKFDYIEYSSGSLNKLSSGMIIKGVISLSDTWSEKKSSTLSLVHMGTYKGITNGYLKTSIGGEYKYILLDPSGYSIYSTDSAHKKFKSAGLSDIIGKDIWVISVGDIARAIYFEK